MKKKTRCHILYWRMHTAQAQCIKKKIKKNTNRKNEKCTQSIDHLHHHAMCTLYALYRSFLSLFMRIIVKQKIIL